MAIAQRARCPTCGRGIRRSIEQNSRMWAMCRDVARQVEWHGQWLSEGDWKEMFTAALKRQRVVPGLEGGFVVLGASTSQMTVGELSELMELIAAFGVEHGVEFKDERSKS